MTIIINMFLIAHITLALSGLVASSTGLIHPRKAILGLAAGLVLATLLSGSFLVFSAHSALKPACIAGLAYCGLNSAMIMAGRYRLHAAAAKN